MKTVISVLILYALLYTGSSKPASSNDGQYPTDEDLLNDAGDTYYDYDGDKTDTSSPSDENDENFAILSLNSTLNQYQNDTFTLPCETTAIEPVRLWYKGELVYFQSDMNVVAPPNIKLNPNGSLTITNFKKEDEGIYKCTLMTNERPVVYHTVHFRPDYPQIEVLAAKDNLTALGVDNTISLKCIAHGRPKPHISWHKGAERLATEGENLVITNIKHINAGIYRCLADNKIDPPAHAEIEIKVEHKPAVSIEKITVNSDSNYDTELKCIVHAEPRASVVWKKDGVNIISSSHIQLKNEGHNHIIILKGLQEDDFGNYTCSATNSLGVTNKHVKLVKTPAILRFIKPQTNSKDVVLTWEVQSKSPISQHEIQWRKKGGDGKWDVIVPEVTNSADDDIYTVKYQLKGLEPGKYETRIRSQNQHGWSEFSDPTVFEGAIHGHGKHKHKNHQKEGTILTSAPDVVGEHHKEETPRTASSEKGGASPMTSSVALLSITVLFLYIRQ